LNNVIVSIIAAMDRNRGIGAGAKLPWRLSADLKRFRDLTMGHHIIVGRKTYESIVQIGGGPLPGRRMIVVTRDRNYKADGCDAAYSIEDAIGLARERGESEAFICGGAEIYSQSIGIVDRMYLTFIEAEVAADTFFPEFDEREWSEQDSFYQPADEKNQYQSIFKLLVASAGAFCITRRPDVSRESCLRSSSPVACSGRPPQTGLSTVHRFARSGVKDKSPGRRCRN
jgi:dihydrofolate reductase